MRLEAAAAAAALVVCWSMTGAVAQENSLLDYYERLREAFAKALGPRDRHRNLRTARQFNMMQEEVAEDRSFPCDTSFGRSPSAPDSVHRLRPGDIDVIAALGDSLTAGYGNVASNVLQVAIENRGMSWSIGGEGTWRQYLTLPNILKEFNPALVGFSLNDSLSHQQQAQFNVAEGGAMSRDLPFQARLLLRRMRAHPGVDFDRHWKMVTILIGGNDFCIDMCYDGNAHSEVENHRRDLYATLDYLRANLPRTIVNLVVTPHLRMLVDVTDWPESCWLTHHLECPCLMGTRFQSRRREFYDIMTRWQQVDLDVGMDMKYLGLNDFAVVVQPFLLNSTLPKVNTPGGMRTDYSLLSKDCFHLSQKGAARGANALWNNLMQPVGEKSFMWNETFSEFLCPTPDKPYIYTVDNSRVRRRRAR